MHYQSFFKYSHHRSAGFSFVELLVTAAIVTLVFGGLFAAVQAMIVLISDSKAKAGALSLATERLEFLRSLEYDAVGTVSGVPTGLIPQTRSVILNGMAYHERVLVEFVDDPADGLDVSDSNGIVSDYKRAKVEYSWLGKNGTSSVALVSNIVPPGVETTAGGGTLRVYVNDASLLPVAGASVRFVNSTGATPIDTVRFTDASGVATLGGAPALSDYEIYVSRAGYSTDGTSVAGGVLSSPNQPVVSVAVSSVTTQYFQIDELSTVQVTTSGVPTFADTSDTFTDSTLIASTTETTVGGGEVVLAGTPGSYSATGVVLATSTTPSPLESWYSVDWSAVTSASTSVRVSVYYPVGMNAVLVPDSDLPGNSIGFTSTPIDISALDPSSYPTLILGATLATIDSTETPVLEEWSLTHVATQPSLAGVPITVTGSKSLGLNSLGAPVLKNIFSDSTDASGEQTFSDIEYDVYTISVDDPSVDVLEVCPGEQIILNPDSTETVNFTIGSVSGPRLLVAVTDTSNQPVPSASVRLEQSGYDVTQTTSLCGQTFFSGGSLSTDTATVTVSKSGFVTATESAVPITSTSTLLVPLN